MEAADIKYIQSLIDFDHEVICKSGWKCCGRMMPPGNDFIKRTNDVIQREINRIGSGIPIMR